jgi:hypothetical protein
MAPLTLALPAQASLAALRRPRRSPSSAPPSRLPVRLLRILATSSQLATSVTWLHGDTRWAGPGVPFASSKVKVEMIRYDRR